MADMDEALIEAVRRYPCLWQSSSSKYKDLRAKENAWKEVAKEVGSEVGDCKGRWKTIRDRYVRELKRVKRRKSGDGAGDVYTPTWSLYNLLSFLNKSVRHRQSDTNLEVAAEVVVPADNSIVEDMADLEDSNCDNHQLTSSPSPSRSSSVELSSVELSSQASRSSSVELLSQPSSSKKESPQASKRKRKRDDKEVDDLLIKNLKALEEPTKVEDEEDLFGRQMAITLR